VSGSQLDGWNEAAMPGKSEIEGTLKQMIVRRLDLKIAPADISSAAALFDKAGLGLDSVEALEIVVGIEEEFHVAVEEAEGLKQRLFSVSTMADYVAELLQTKPRVVA